MSRTPRLETSEEIAARLEWHACYAFGSRSDCHARIGDAVVHWLGGMSESKSLCVAYSKLTAIEYATLSSAMGIPAAYHGACTENNAGRCFTATSFAEALEIIDRVAQWDREHTYE